MAKEKSKETQTDAETDKTDPKGDTPKDDEPQAPLTGDAAIDAKNAEIDKAISDGEARQSDDEETPKGEDKGEPKPKPKAKKADTKPKADEEPETTPPASDDETPAEDEPEKGEGDDEVDDDESDLSPKQQSLLTQFGMTEDALPDPGPARDAVFAQLTTSRRQISRKMSELGQAAMAAPETDTPKKPDAGKDADAETESTDADASDVEFTADDLEAEDDSLVTKLNALAGRLKSQDDEIAGLKGQISSQASAHGDEQQTATDKAVDDFFGGLWTDDEDGNPTTEYPQYGEDVPLADLDPDSFEAMARRAVSNKAATIAAGYEARNMPVPDELELLEAAHDLLTAKETKQENADLKRSRAKAARKRKSAPRKSTPRPRTKPAKTSDDRFNEEIDAFERQHGVTVPP